MIQLYEEEQQKEIQFAIDSIIIQKETDLAMKVQINKALQQLTDKQREAIFLRFYEELSYVEIAGVMNISVKATYKLMARALNELKELFSIPIVFINL